ncbi:nitrile hydratase subunit alpha [Citrobacter portucalensis]|uniref:nitrile hydratase subunit alpha n=1 Tax=Citrobacter portucalensis TaxID=1639133 RepID=UPI001C6FFC75|nr:nitrile hydratase subunit alpha [Citrobacter portucalensis]
MSLHEHSHDEITEAGEPNFYEVMEIAIRELLTEKGYIGADEIRRQIEVLDSGNGANLLI